MVKETKLPGDARPLPNLTPKQQQGKEQLSSRTRHAIQETGVPTSKEASSQSLRQKAVNRAWEQERQLVRLTNQGTRNWKPNQTRSLRESGKVPGYEGHHIRSVNRHTTKWAGDPRNIVFVTRPEHLELHGRDFRNPTTGHLIDRPSTIRMAQANRQSVRSRNYYM